MTFSLAPLATYGNGAPVDVSMAGPFLSVALALNPGPGTEIHVYDAGNPANVLYTGFALVDPANTAAGGLSAWIRASGSFDDVYTVYANTTASAGSDWTAEHEATWNNPTSPTVGTWVYPDTTPGAPGYPPQSHLPCTDCPPQETGRGLLEGPFPFAATDFSVQFASGEEVKTVPIVRMPSVGIDMEVYLTYRSRRTFDGRYGQSWFLNHDVKLETEANGDLTYHNGYGRLDAYVSQGGGVFTPPVHYDTALSVVGNQTFITDRFGTTATYRQPGSTHRAPGPLREPDGLRVDRRPARHDHRHAGPDDDAELRVGRSSLEPRGLDVEDLDLHVRLPRAASLGDHALDEFLPERAPLPLLVREQQRDAGVRGKPRPRVEPDGRGRPDASLRHERHGLPGGDRRRPLPDRLRPLHDEDHGDRPVGEHRGVDVRVLRDGHEGGGVHEGAQDGGAHVLRHDLQRERDDGPDRPRGLPAGQPRGLHVRHGEEPDAGAQADPGHEHERCVGHRGELAVRGVRPAASSYTDPQGRTTSYTLDGYGNTTQVTHPTVTSPSNQSVVGDLHLRLAGQDAHGDATVPIGVVQFTYYTSGAQTGYLQSVIRDPAGLALTTTFSLRRVRKHHVGAGPPRRDDQITVDAENFVTEIQAPSPLSYRRKVTYDEDRRVTKVEVENRDKDGTLDASWPWIDTRLRVRQGRAAPHEEDPDLRRRPGGQDLLRSTTARGLSCR